MDTSVGSSRSETTSAARQTEDPVMTLTKTVSKLQLEDDKNTTPTSPIKESGTMQGKDSNTIDEDDDSTCSMPMRPPTTPSKNSLPLKTNNSNPMDTSLETTYSKTTSADSTTEDSVMMAGDERNTMDTSIASTSHGTPIEGIEGSSFPLEDDANRKDRRTEIMCGADTSSACPAGGSAIMSGEDSNSLQIGTEYPQYHKFYPRVRNLTVIEFNEAESAFLNKHLKFIIEPDFDHNLVVELLEIADTAAKGLEQNKRWRMQYELWETIENKLKKKKKGIINQKFLAYKSTLKSINDKLSKGNAVAIKGDDGDFIVIMNEQNYIEETVLCLKKVAKPAKATIQNDLKDLGKKVKEPYAPELIPRIKGDLSIRLLINTENSPVYNETMELDKFIRDNYVFDSKYSVSSSMALINEIKNKEITKSCRLATLVIRDLYANVPVAKTIEIIEKNLINNGKADVGKNVELLKRVANFNYFSFNGKIYKQKAGMIMGSSLSDTMADIFMNSRDHTLNSDRNFSNKIVYYGRSVDKILLLVDGNEAVINEICKTLNRLFDTSDDIVNTEHECDNCIQFLDLCIKRLQNQLTFSIYRKPTTTDVVIPQDSCHPQKDKEAAFRSLLYRAYNMPMSEEERLYELNIIKQIANSNGYDMDMVDRLLDDQKTKIVRAPYYGKMSDKLADIFKPCDVKFDFQVKNLLEYDLERLDLENRKIKQVKAGVYKSKCSKKLKNGEECRAIYIGQTKREISLRIDERNGSW